MAGLPAALLPLAALFLGSEQHVSPPPVGEELAATIIALGQLQERMTVPVQVAGAGPYSFVIDTGSERTVISSELARTLKLPAGQTVTVTAMSGVSRVNTVIVPSIRLSDVPDIGAIQAPAFGAMNLGALGLLGIDTLRDHRIDIDFEKNHMAVVPSVKRDRRRPAQTGEIVVRAKSLLGQLIVTEAEFDGHPIRVVIDTGSPISLGNSAMQRLVRRRNAGRLQPLDLVSVTGGTVSTEWSMIDDVNIAGLRFQDLPMAFADAAPFKRLALDERPAMFLGMSALRFFRRVQIDFANREIRFLMPRDIPPPRPAIGFR